MKKVFAKSTGKHLCQSLILIKLQVFSCEFCEIFKNTFCHKHLQTTAYVFTHFQYLLSTDFSIYLSHLVLGESKQILNLKQKLLHLQLKYGIIYIIM